MGYFGSKATSGLCQPLIAMMPPHDTYIETHLGGGALMRRKPAALHNIGIDRDAGALGEFECDYRVELIHGCAHRFLSEYAFEGSELIYSDPPYTISAEVSVPVSVPVPVPVHDRVRGHIVAPPQARLPRLRGEGHLHAQGGQESQGVCSLESGEMCFVHDGPASLALCR